MTAAAVAVAIVVAIVVLAAAAVVVVVAAVAGAAVAMAAAAQAAGKPLVPQIEYLSTAVLFGHRGCAFGSGENGKRCAAQPPIVNA